MSKFIVPMTAYAFDNQPRSFFEEMQAEFRRLLNQQGRQNIFVSLDLTSVEEQAPVIEFYMLITQPKDSIAAAENIFGIARIEVRIPCSGEGDSLEEFELVTFDARGVEKTCSHYEVASDVLIRIAGAIHALLPHN